MIIKSTVREAALKVLGKIENCLKGLIFEGTIQLLARAHEARISEIGEPRRLKSETSRSARAGRKRYWMKVAEKMEIAAGIDDFGKLLRLIRNASSRRCKQRSLLRDAAGQLIPEQKRKVERWVEHFDGLLNRPSDHTTALQPPLIAEPYDVS